MRHFSAAWTVGLLLLGGCDENAELRHARVVDPPWPVATFELTDHSECLRSAFG